ncbi:MAG: elongation factor G [Oscillospiraceae bacterium]|jgi:elongation factor G|nr:elongation factor G [Oscillospiraceae bacterium]
MAYTSDAIRNIALLGHGGNGKTSLAESMLYLSGGIDRMGKVADGNTASDSDSEEIKRRISISLATLSADYRNGKVNILDTPGYFDFSGEVAQALRVADSGIIVCGAKDGVTVGLEKSYKYLSDLKLPRAFYISKIDEENGSFDNVYAALREKYGTPVCPMVAPITDGTSKIAGLVDLISRKAYSIDGGKRKEIPIPADMGERLETLYTAVNESVAETSEELMDKYFSGVAFTEDEIKSGLRAGVRELTLFPVYCGCALTGLGTLTLLDAITDLMPSPLDGRLELSPDGAPLDVGPDAPPAAVVYKTVSDQYGKFSLFKVISGNVRPDCALTNARTGSPEKLGHIYKMQGKKNSEVTQIVYGDLGAASKLSETKTGDTLCDPKNVFSAEGIAFAPPCYSMAIAPKTKGQEDKIASGLARLGEEDRTFTFANNVETKQLVLSGAGDIQLDVLCAKLKDKFGVDVVLSPARVAYREKIRKKVQVRGRHKKQSGGHGQFGDVVIEFEPGQQEELEFAESVFGGSVPKNFFPAVEKGLRDSTQRGVLAGYPMVYLKATLVDGSYHPVDSSEMAFKTAAQLAYKDGIPQAGPVILEPIGYLTVTIPDTYTGDIMSDLSKRRGSPMGMSFDADGMQVVEAEVPLGEMSSYAIDLRSMTQSRGAFTIRFERYEEAPAAVQAKIIEEAKALAESE